MKYDVPDDASTSVAVVNAVAEFEDREFDSLPPLFEAIDADALDRLLANEPDSDSQSGVKVSFTYSTSKISIRDSGQITIQPATSATSG